MTATAWMLGVVDQTLFDWAKDHRQDKLDAAGNKPKVSAEHTEIARLRAETSRVKIEPAPGKR